LRTGLTRSAKGFFLEWNPRPGHTYQVQFSSNLKGWSDFGSPRFAAGTRDAVYLGGTKVAYYRILCLH
jgi:hypothetical protein